MRNEKLKGGIKLLFGLFIITMVSCKSTAKFVSQSKNQTGFELLSDYCSLEVMNNACLYAIQKSGLSFDYSEKQNDSTLVLYATMGSTMQSWGQHVKMTLKERIISGKSVTEAYYFSAARISANITEDMNAIRRNIKIYAENYIEAEKEGIDMSKFKSGKK